MPTAREKFSGARRTWVGGTEPVDVVLSHGYVPPAQNSDEDLISGGRVDERADLHVTQLRVRACRVGGGGSACDLIAADAAIRIDVETGAIPEARALRIEPEAKGIADTHADELFAAGRQVEGDRNEADGGGGGHAEFGTKVYVGGYHFNE